MYLDYISYAKFSLLKLSSLLQESNSTHKNSKICLWKTAWQPNQFWSPNNGGFGVWVQKLEAISNDEQLGNNLPASAGCRASPVPAHISNPKVTRCNWHLHSTGSFCRSLSSLWLNRELLPAAGSTGRFHGVLLPPLPTRAPGLPSTQRLTMHTPSRLYMRVELRLGSAVTEDP